MCHCQLRKILERYNSITVNRDSFRIDTSVSHSIEISSVEILVSQSIEIALAEILLVHIE